MISSSDRSRLKPAGQYHICVLTGIDLDRLIADTEAAMLRVIDAAEDERTSELYAMVRYHMGLDRDGPRGKRFRPLIGLLAYQSIAGEHLRALPGAAAVEMGHNFSLVHDDIEDRRPERRHRPALWTVAGVPQAINTGDTLFTLSRMALHRLTDEGFSDAKVLALMRLYDETCLALCEGQFMDIWTTEHDEWRTVDWYFDMIGRKTAALIAGSAQAGAMLATDDEAIVVRATGASAGRSASPSSSTTTSSASGATSRRPARRPPTSRPGRRRCRSSTPSRRRRAPTASGSTRSSVRPAMTPPPTKRTRCAPSSSASGPVPTRAPGPLDTVTTRSQEIAPMGIIEREARERLELIVRAAISA